MSRHDLKAILLSKIGENMKQYFTGFITAMVFTSSLFLFIGAKKRTIDNLIVQKITIVDGSGDQVGEIGSNKNNSYLWLKSTRSKKPNINLVADKRQSEVLLRGASGQDAISLGINKNMGGNIRVNQKNGSRALVLESDKIGNGQFVCYNHREKETLFVGTNDINSGQIKTFNALGVETVFLGTDDNDAGLVGVNNNSGKMRAVLGVDEIGVGLVETVKK